MVGQGQVAVSAALCRRSTSRKRAALAPCGARVASGTGSLAVLSLPRCPAKTRGRRRGVAIGVMTTLAALSCRYVASVRSHFGSRWWGRGKWRSRLRFADAPLAGSVLLSPPAARAWPRVLGAWLCSPCPDAQRKQEEEGEASPSG
mmetsp:Transcript_2067/g.1643  ORF Transcript_2067/g.1643 Transcript_2067/m.1643 type:complete len:146 (+) Transcript_2067:23-460(+)